MRWKTWAACAAIAALASITQAATIVDYNLTGLTTTAPTTTPATTVAAGVTADPLSRGPGINPAGLTNGFSSDNWTNVAADTGTIDKARAISMGDFYQWAITVDATHTVSLSGFDTNLRRSAVDAPMNFELQYSFDNFAMAGTTAAQFMYLGRSRHCDAVSVDDDRYARPGQRQRDSAAESLQRSRPAEYRTGFNSRLPTLCLGKRFG